MFVILPFLGGYLGYINAPAQDRVESLVVQAKQESRIDNLVPEKFIEYARIGNFGNFTHDAFGISKWDSSLVAEFIGSEEFEGYIEVSDHAGFDWTFFIPKSEFYKIPLGEEVFASRDDVCLISFRNSLGNMPPMLEEFQEKMKESDNIPSGTIKTMKSDNVTIKVNNLKITSPKQGSCLFADSVDLIGSHDDSDDVLKEELSVKENDCGYLPQQSMNICYRNKVNDLEKEILDSAQKSQVEFDSMRDSLSDIHKNENQPLPDADVSLVVKDYIEAINGYCGVSSIGSWGGSIRPTIISQCKLNLLNSLQEEIRHFNDPLQKI